jgi:hypothetical protein
VSSVGCTVADLYTMTHPREASTLNGGPSKPVPFLHEMADPNARLIAAAPELYEALVALAEFVDRHVIYADSDPLLTAAERAIRKARGEQVPA